MSKKELLLDGIVKYTLYKPVTSEGVEYKEITLNFDDLSGDDIVTAEFDIAKSGQMVAGLAEFNKTYLMHISARAAKLPIEVFKHFHIKDISAITRETQGFLMG